MQRMACATVCHSSDWNVHDVDSPDSVEGMLRRGPYAEQMSPSFLLAGVFFKESRYTLVRQFEKVHTGIAFAVYPTHPVLPHK